MGTGILTKLRTAGITLSIDGDNLVATPKTALTDELRSLIRTHKAAILAELAPIAGLPKPRAPVNLDEVLAAACEGVAGITPGRFRALLSPQDVADIEAGHPPQDLGRVRQVIRRGHPLGADRRSGRRAMTVQIRRGRQANETLVSVECFA